MPAALDINEVSRTIERLIKRISERFPESGLRKIAKELYTVSLECADRSRYISRPQIALRFGIGGLIALGTLLLLFALTQIAVKETYLLGELVQITDATLNIAVLTGAGIFFLITVEIRIKRSRALESLNQLRSIAHVIDMHQLTKDPASTLNPNPTPASPSRKLSVFELNRYLDYCAELLSLTGKIAAIFGQSLNDREVIAAANGIEDLTSNLSRKVWQKLGSLPVS